MKRLLTFVALAGALAASSAANAQLKKPFLWVLSKNGKTATLFGSLHVGKPDFYPVPPMVRSRFDTADVIAVEVDVTRDDTRVACNRLAATNDKLEKLLPEDEMQQLSRYAKASSLDLKKLDGRKLWMVNLILTVTELTQLGVDFEDGIDLVITREAQFQKKRVVEVEGAKQCTSLAGVDGPEAVAGMNRFLTAVRENKMERRINDMINAYRLGDGEAIAKITIDEFGDSPIGKRSRARVFDDRHGSMAETIDGYLGKNEKHFIAIGVAHMFGPTNLLQALEKRGIKVTPLVADSALQPAAAATASPTAAPAPTAPTATSTTNAPAKK